MDQPDPLLDPQQSGGLTVMQGGLGSVHGGPGAGAVHGGLGAVNRGAPVGGGHPAVPLGSPAEKEGG